MNGQNQVAVLGGDERQVIAAELFAEMGVNVRTYGTMRAACGISHSDSAVDAVRDCNTVVFPLPATKNGVYLNEKNDFLTPVEVILDAVSPNTEIYAGRVDDNFRSLCVSRGLSLTDYYTSERFTVKNAVLTAEGALEIYMKEKKLAVADSSLLVIGSGRVAKCVMRIFSALGARITVMARNHGELAMAESLGHEITDITDGKARLNAFARGYDAIVNTVPVNFMTGCCLYVIPDGTLVIDLASAPYGIEPVEAKKIGINAIRAAALPGKYAPESAARIIVDEIAARMKFSGGNL